MKVNTFTQNILYTELMTILTSDQIRQLNMYSTYITPPTQPLCTSKQIREVDFLPIVQTITGIDTKTVAASYFMRRYGLFISTQFLMLATYDELWMGELNELLFGVNVEYGAKNISMHVNQKQYVDVEKEQREEIIKKILFEQIHLMIVEIRKYASVSTLTLWENVFGFLLWHYAVLLNQPSTQKQARVDMEILKSDEVWVGIASHSLFKPFLNGLEPSQLLNTIVRKTCCLSKHVPGLQKCGFCPIE